MFPLYRVLFNSTLDTCTLINNYNTLYGARNLSAFHLYFFDNAC